MTFYRVNRSHRYIARQVGVFRRVAVGCVPSSDGVAGSRGRLWRGAADPPTHVRVQARRAPSGTSRAAPPYDAGKNGKLKKQRTPRRQDPPGRCKWLADRRPGRRRCCCRRRSSTSTRRPSCPTRTRTSRPRRRSSTTTTARPSSGEFAMQNRDVDLATTTMPQDIKDAGRRRREPHLLDRQRHRPQGHRPRRVQQRPGNATQGASTITQQYIKILYLTQERSYTRKLKEAILSLKLQRQQSKQRDPRGLPQHHLLRPRCLRRPGRGAGLLRQGRQGARPQAERGAGQRHQQPRRSSTRPTARTQRSALRERYDYVLDGMARPGRSPPTRRPGRPRAAAEVPDSRRPTTVRRPEGPRAHAWSSTSC